MRGSVKLLRTRRARSFPHGKRKFMIGVFLSGRIPTTNIATAIKSAGTRLSLLTAISLARPSVALLALQRQPCCVKATTVTFELKPASYPPVGRPLEPIYWLFMLRRFRAGQQQFGQRASTFIERKQ